MTPTNGAPKSLAFLLNFEASIWETWYPLGVVLTSNLGELLEKSSFLPDFSKIDPQTLIFRNGLKEPVWHLSKLLWQKERENKVKKEGKKERWGQEGKEGRRREGKKGKEEERKKALSISDRNARLFQVDEMFYFELLEAFNIVKVYHALPIEK